MYKNKKNGFTLVEILVVILIIGLLFVFLVPKIDSATDKARETGIKTDFRSYQTAFEAVAREQGGLGSQAIFRESTAEGGAKSMINLVNYYLDPALQIEGGTDVSGDTGDDLGEVTNNGDSTLDAKEIRTKTKLDPWNNNYVIQWKAWTADGTNNNNGVIQIYTRGKDSKGGTQLPTEFKKKDEVTTNMGLTRGNAGDNVHDDYSLTTVYVDGAIYTCTVGFSTDIKAVG